MLLLILAGCGPAAYYPMDSVALQDQALRMAATETAAPYRTAESGQATEQAYVAQTAQSAQITEAAFLAAIRRGTEIAVESTGQAEKDKMLNAHAAASATNAWLNGQLVQIPTDLASTQVRQQQVAERAAKTQDIGWWTVIWICGILIFWLGSLVFRISALRIIDEWRIVQNMAKARRQGTQSYDVTKQTKAGHGR